MSFTRSVSVMEASILDTGFLVKRTVSISDVEAEAEAGSGSAGSGYFLWKRKHEMNID